MTTDEVQQTGERRATQSSDDEFSSENYIRKSDAAPPDPTGSAAPTPQSSDMVILGTVPGELDDDETDAAAAAADAEAGDDIDTPADDESHDDTDDDPAGETADDDSAGPTDDAEDGITTDDTYLEMRQVAGLTAGSMMKLTVGRAFEFNESNEGGSFSLRVLENGEVLVHPGTARAVLDEVEVDEPMLIGDGLLNVSSACFSVRRPRPPASRESRMESIGATFASISAITVPALGAEEPLPPDQLTGSRLGTIVNRNPLTRGAVGRSAWNFLQSIRRTRSVVAERHRLLHPDPEELKTRLSRLDPGLWERSRGHPLFGRFGIGYANIPWEPRFDNPELIPEVLHEPILEMSLLPWVPVTANLLYGPLGIVGKRTVRLAACRHAILSLAALTMPGEVQFAVRSGKNTATSWNWARALPPVMSAGDDSPYVVTVIDGAEGARLDETAREATYDEAIVHDPAATGEVPVVRVDGDDGNDTDSDGTNSDDPDDETDNEGTDAVFSPDAVDEVGSARGLIPGYIVLADSVDELTQPCGTVLQIEPDGTGSVTNHLNETIQVTPIGVTEAFAHDMATRIADILTNSFL
ncbi:MAG: hypothetical protein OES24_10475 [Acidimicrobiia bacterium]|nr:hypothetical protein [Acidimicrobiia bacterium]